MKKKFLFCTVLFFLPFFSSAQSYISAELKFPMEQHTIVRNWDDKYALSLVYANNGSPLFVSSDFSGFFGTFNPNGFNANARYSDSLSHRYIINDIQILEDTAFFCGAKHVSSNPNVYIGFVGYFDLQQFMTGYFNPVIHEIASVTSFHRMTVYLNNDRSKVVVIGSDTLGNPNNVFMEIDKVTDFSPIVKLHSLTASERLDDVLYTGNSIVFVGTVGFGVNALIYIKILDNPHNLISSSQFGRFFHSTGTGEINARTKSTLLTDGIIAVSYVHIENTPTPVFYKRVRTIDTHAPMPTNINSQEFKMDDKMETRDMVYSITSGKLVLLQEPYTVNPLFYFLDPFMTYGYYANQTFFQNGTNYYSIDLYNLDNIISVGFSRAYLQNISNQTNYGCPYKNFEIVEIIPKLIFDEGFSNPSFSMFICNTSYYYLSTYPSNWGTSCFTY